jgi:hypothetical protein
VTTALITLPMQRSTGQTEDPPPTLPPGAEAKAHEIDDKVIKQRLKDKEARNRINNNRNLFVLLSMMEEDQNPFGVLELLGKQKQELTDLQKEYKEQVDKTWNRKDLTPLEIRNELGKLKSKYISKFNEVLLPHQLKELALADIDKVGVHKALTESVIGEALGLSDRQKKQIRTKSDKMAGEIKDFIVKIRQKSHDVVFDVLTDDQAKKLLKAFDERQFILLFEQTNLQVMYRHLLYEKAKDGGQSIFRTKVERKAFEDVHK